MTNRISYNTMHFGANPNLSKIVQIQQFFDSCCPGADIAPASTEPNVRNPPNFAQSTRDINPFSPIAIPIIGTYNLSLSNMHLMLM